MGSLVRGLVVVAALIAASSCASGEERVDGGQVDYLERFVEWSQGLGPDAGPSALLDERSTALADELEQLDAPTGLEQSHDAAVIALRDLSASIVDLKLAKSDAERENATSRSTEAIRVVVAHGDAVSDHYRVYITHVRGDSMAPAFCDGTAVTMNVYRDEPLPRWAVIGFLHRSVPETALMKRIAGLPGDTVEVIAGVVFVDRERVEGDIYPAFPPSYDAPTVKVPEGRYYVLGDNRDASLDSHSFDPVAGVDRAYWSTVPLSDILGWVSPETTACRIYFDGDA